MITRLRPGLSAPWYTVGSSSGVRTGYCARLTTARSACQVSGAASLSHGCWPERISTKRYGDTPMAASTSAATANRAAPRLAANANAAAEADCPDEHQCDVPQAGADQERPDSGQHRHLSPLAPRIRRSGGGLMQERGHDAGDDRGAGQQRQQMGRDRQSQQEDGQQQQPRRGRLWPSGAPAYHQPAEGGDQQQRGGVDLGLVGILPDGERECREQRSGGAAGEPQPPAGRSSGGRALLGHRAMEHQKEPAGRERAANRAEQVGSNRIAADGEHRRPDMAGEYEERRGGRVRECPARESPRSAPRRPTR